MSTEPRLGRLFYAYLFLFITSLILRLFNTGFWAALMIAAVVWVIVFSFINFLEKQEKSKEGEAVPYASSDAVSHKSELCSEFEKLVTEIAYYHARSNDELRVLVRKEGELKDKVLISQEDMEVAFLEAIENLYVFNLTPASPSLCSFFTGCDKEAQLIEKIRGIRKLYEPKTP